MAAIMQRLGMERGEAIEHKMVSRAVENAQKKVEGMNYDQRKNLLEYDNVANDQRKVVYQLRDELMQSKDVQSRLIKMREKVITDLFESYISNEQPEEEWNVESFQQILKTDYGMDAPIQTWLKEGVSVDDLLTRILQGLEEIAQYKEQLAGLEAMRGFEKAVMLQTLDHHWKEHLASMDYLRQSIGLRGYAQKNPTQEYKEESFAMFSELLDKINVDFVKALSSVTIDENTSASEVEQQNNEKAIAEYAVEDEEQTYKRNHKKTGRNEPCPCGSGKKYKNCHG
jgi:preprotein translocase subunit SecA